MEGKGGGGEVRRLHIIYFLSHMGHVEHPHLIRIHHFTRTGVYLRDVKRWLGDLRGKDMPEAYAWSYKRRYKTGYVWQDLVDDDLITPLSDNEYVLKGSQIISTPNDEKRDSHSYSCGKKGANSTHKEHPNKVKSDQIIEDKVQPETTTNFSFKESQKKIFPDSKIDPPSKIFSEINEESSSFGSDRSSLTDDFDSVKFEATKNLAPTTLNNNNDNNNISTPSYTKKSKNKNKNKNKIRSNDVEEMGSSSRMSSSSRKSPMPAKRKSFSGVGGASNVLRNLISCGAVDTNDKVLVMLNRSGGGHKSSSSGKNKLARDHEVFKGVGNDHLGRPARVFGTCWDDHQEEKQQPQRHSTSRRSFEERKGPKFQQTEFTKQRPSSAAYRPVGEPNCAQCGKNFKPEKMHSHMKSCRGMKGLGKSKWSNINDPTPLQKNTVSHSQGSYEESSLGFFLTN